MWQRRRTENKREWQGAATQTMFSSLCPRRILKITAGKCAGPKELQFRPWRGILARRGDDSDPYACHECNGQRNDNRPPRTPEQTANRFTQTNTRCGLILCEANLSPHIGFEIPLRFDVAPSLQQCA